MEKILTVLFNRVPNHQTGQMGYAERTVGRGYYTGEIYGVVSQIEKGWEEMTHDPIIAVTYETGSGKILTQTIPFKNDVELIYEDNSRVTEEPAE